MRKCLILMLVALLSSPVSAAAGSSRERRITTGAIIGAAGGMFAGWLYWQANRDCGICGPGPAGSMLRFGVFGAGFGAFIGSMGRSSPDQRRGIPLGRHVSAATSISPSRSRALVRITF